jgi:hypothetical protein
MFVTLIDPFEKGYAADAAIFRIRVPGLLLPRYPRKRPP